MDCDKTFVTHHSAIALEANQSRAGGPLPSPLQRYWPRSGHDALTHRPRSAGRLL